MKWNKYTNINDILIKTKIVNKFQQATLSDFAETFYTCSNKWNQKVVKISASKLPEISVPDILACIVRPILQASQKEVRKLAKCHF